MLLSLHIENIAVIKSVDLDFTRGFAALTGETGAGKSVIIDSIHLLLGKKIDKDLIRTGESTLMVSGLFGEFSEPVLKKINDLGVSVDEDGCILVQRTVSRDGKGSVRFNTRAVSLSFLHELVPLLISIHGQSDTRSLTDPSKHLVFLDSYAAHAPLLADYREAYREYEQACRELNALKAAEADRERKMEMLLYQVRDIDSLSLHEGEEEELIDKKVKLKSVERIQKNLGFVFKALKGLEKGSATFLADRSITALSQLADCVSESTALAERLRECLYTMDDVAEEVYALLDEMEDTRDMDINDIEHRLDQISKLKRKYGFTVAEVLAYREKAAAEYHMLENRDDLLLALTKKRDEAYDSAHAIAEKLHDSRVHAAKRLEKTVKDTLEFLDMPNVVFFASMCEEYKEGQRVLNSDGFDSVEFYISANRGAEPQPLAKIASGGELARIMLAIKCALADKDGIPTLIFDEIDAGVSGKTARKIGLKMHELASLSQVICVTHSAQIASLADLHFLISKAVKNGSTLTSVAVLDKEGRVNEISRILGGINVTAAQREAAIDMLADRFAQM